MTPEEPGECSLSREGAAPVERVRLSSKRDNGTPTLKILRGDTACRYFIAAFNPGRMPQAAS